MGSHERMGHLHEPLLKAHLRPPGPEPDGPRHLLDYRANILARNFILSPKSTSESGQLGGQFSPASDTPDAGTDSFDFSSISMLSDPQEACRKRRAREGELCLAKNFLEPIVALHGLSTRRSLKIPHRASGSICQPS